MKRSLILLYLSIGGILGSLTLTATAEDTLPMIFEDFTSGATERWDYVADRVMGGVSSGEAQIVRDGAYSAVHLTGTVSTDNNGGFIQVRHRFAGGWGKDTRGLRISAKGNDQIFYVFLRTKGLSRVWYSYRFAFEVSSEWAEFEMDFDQFKPSHEGMPKTFTPDIIQSIGFVAYGRNHEADLTVRQIEIY